MQRVKQFIHYFDFFAHTNFQRYKTNDYYSTLTGGILSILLIIMFLTLYVKQSVDTVNKEYIETQFVREYDETQQQNVLVASPSNNFMFSVGISGVNLSSSIRYFDILMTNVVRYEDGINNTQNVVLTPCRKQQWEEFSDDKIGAKFYDLRLDQWLCPPNNTTIPLKGKYSSIIFKYSIITVRKCTQNQLLFPGTTCANSTEFNRFVKQKKNFFFNFYFVNSAINVDLENYLDYYLQDRNYFVFDTQLASTANLYFEQYSVQSDQSYMPWEQLNIVKGLLVNSQANNQQYFLQENDYFKLHLRKGYFRYQYERRFKKFDQIFAYAGGLLSTILVLCSFIRIYNRYCYQLEMGDQMFKQKNNASFGSQHFNFIVFIGYAVYVFIKKFIKHLNWKTMKKFHECRSQCQKQLNIGLQMMKISHFEYISKVVLEDHHLNMLLMVPKPTISSARLHRKKFDIKDQIYHQIERKGRDIYIEQSFYGQKWLDYLARKRKNSHNQDNTYSIQVQNEKSQSLNIHKSIKASYQKLKQQLQSSKSISKKVLALLGSNDITKMLCAAKKQDEHIVEQDHSESKISLNNYLLRKQASYDQGLPNIKLQTPHQQLGQKQKQVRSKIWQPLTQILSENTIDLKIQD